MAKKKMLLIVNPKAGKGQIKNHLLQIVNLFVENQYDVTIHVTQCAGDALKETKDRDASYKLIVCCGGDGTLDEVVTGMVKSGKSVPIGYIPAGSTNDFANSLGLSKNMETCAADIMNGKLFPCDIGSFNRDIFVYVAAFGLFTDVSYGTGQEMKNFLGYMAYILEGVKRLASINSYHMRFVYEDTVIEDDFIFGMITNSVSVGGFKKITGKNVELNDGQMEVTLIKKPTSTLALNQLINALSEKNPENEFIYWFKTSRLQVESEEEIPWTRDGEFGGNHKEILIEDYKEAIQIIIPKGK